MPGSNIMSHIMIITLWVKTEHNTHVFFYKNHTIDFNMVIILNFDDTQIKYVQMYKLKIYLGRWFACVHRNMYVMQRHIHTLYRNLFNLNIVLLFKSMIPS